MSNTTSVSSAIVDPSNPIKYIIMQICYIPSIICSIFTLTHLLLNRNLRWALHNHMSLISLIISICDSLLNHPLTLNYLRNSHRGRVLFHYIPLPITTIIYPIMVNTVTIFLLPCRNQFNMMVLLCGYPCGVNILSAVLYVRFAHQFIPVFIVTGATLTLIIRVIKQKRQVQNDRFSWRRYRWMIIQLFSLASLFCILSLPATIVSIVKSCCLATFAVTVEVSYLDFLVQFVTIFMPFFCLSSLPEIRSKLRLCKNTQVHPIDPTRIRTIRT